MFVLSSKAVARMELHDQFRKKIYKEYGLRPVFRIQNKYSELGFEKKDEVSIIAGHPISGVSYRMLSDEEILEKNPDLPPRPSREELDEFLDLEDKWIAEKMLEKYDWATFEEQVKNSAIADKEGFMKAHCACNGNISQCTMFCPKFPCEV